MTAPITTGESQQMTTRTDARPDISEHVKAICDVLGLRYERVARLDVGPTSVDATFYLDGEDGRKFVVGSDPAYGIRTFDVRT